MSLVNAVFVSDSSGGFHVYDLDNGSMLMYYKCGIINPRCLSILRNDYIFAAEKGPLIHVWQINSQERLNSIRMACPGPVGTLHVSPDYCYIAVTTEEKLLVWQICSGKLLCTTRRHYQTISVLEWSKDASYIITGGNDGLICVWKLSDLVTGRSAFDSSKRTDGEVHPKYVFSDHCVKITDLYVGNGGHKARIFTTSLDKTCRVYDLSSGRQLLCVAFDDQLTSITSDPLETNVFTGSTNGCIRVFSLLQPPRSLECHFRDVDHKTTGNNLLFEGHTATVKMLRCTVDGNTLISGSADKTIKIWHINSRQCIRTITMKSEVTNTTVKLLSGREVFASKKNFRSNIALKSFQKTYDPEYNPHVLELITERDLTCSSDSSEDDNELDDNTTIKYSNDDNEIIIANLRNELASLKIANRQLYSFAVENILPANDSKSLVTADETENNDVISQSTLEAITEIRNRTNKEKTDSRKRKRCKKKFKRNNSRSSGGGGDDK